MILDNIREKAHNIGRNINRKGIRYAVQKLKQAWSNWLNRMASRTRLPSAAKRSTAAASAGKTIRQHRTIKAAVLCGNFVSLTLLQFHGNTSSITAKLCLVSTQNLLANHSCSIMRYCHKKNKQRKNERPKRLRFGLSLSIQFIFTQNSSRTAARIQKALAVKTHQPVGLYPQKTLNESNRGHAPWFCYFKREKVPAWELSDDSCFAKSEHSLSEKRSFSTG